MKIKHKGNFKIVCLGSTDRTNVANNTFKYHVFAPMGRFQLELIYLYFPPASHLTYIYTYTYIRWDDDGK